MRVIDTNVLSELLRQMPHRKVYARLGVHAGSLAASMITLEELRYGASRHPNGRPFWQRIEQEILPLAMWIPIDRQIALTAADLRSDLYKKGKTAGTPDCLIAAQPWSTTAFWSRATRPTSGTCPDCRLKTGSTDPARFFSTAHGRTGARPSMGRDMKLFLTCR